MSAIAMEEWTANCTPGRQRDCSPIKSLTTSTTWHTLKGREEGDKKRYGRPHEQRNRDCDKTEKTSSTVKLSSIFPTARQDVGKGI